MKNYLVVLSTWIVFINILYFAPWILIIISVIFGIKVEIGTMILGMNGMVPEYKKFKEYEKKIREYDQEDEE